MDKINNIAVLTRQLTEEDFEEIEMLIESQANYDHPLKMGKQRRMHKLSEHNMRIVEQIKILKDVIEDWNEDEDDDTVIQHYYNNL